jgi:hypothetical protein
MRKMIAVAGMVGFLALAMTARAADLSGTWKGSFEFNGDGYPLTLHLTEADNTVTGTVEGLPTTPTQIHDGKINGDSVTFWVLTDYQGETYKLVYKGQVNEDKIAFTFGTEDGGWSTTMTATRGTSAAPVAADVTGAWKGSFDYEEKTIPLTFDLKASGSTVSGTVEGLPTTPAEIHDGKIDGDTVTFWVNTDYQGETYKLVYKGKVNGDQIEITFGTEDGSWGTTMTATRSTSAAPASPATNSTQQ